MKKLVVVLLLVTVIVQLFGIFGFGANIGTDLLNIPEFNEGFDFEMSGMEVGYSVKRGAISNPVSVGVQAYFDLPIIPIGFEIGANAAAQEYSWSAPNYLTSAFGNIPLELGIDAEDGEYNKSFIFGRLSADASAKYYFFKLPMVKLYVGGGAGLHFITPLVSQELFIQNLENEVLSSTDPTSSNPEIDIKELVLENTAFGGHFITGLRFKPWIFPLSVNLDYKHTFTPINDYEDATNIFGNIRASLNLYF